MVQVVVTHDVKKEEYEILKETLSPIADVVLLPGLAQNDRGMALKSADVLLTWSPTRDLKAEELALITNAKMMQLLSAGADHVPFSKLPPNLFVAANIGAYADPIAEHVLAMILALKKNLIDRHCKLRKGQFDQANPNRMLRGSSCAILGFGGIGKATARLLRCFDVKILALNTSGRTNEQVDFIGTLKDVERVMRLADIVIISIPLTEATRSLIGERELAWMRNDAILINVARGEIVDEPALYEKLKTHPNFMAGIDTWWSEPNGNEQFTTNYPFFELPNVVGSPHNSGNIPGIMNTAVSQAAQNVKRFLVGEKPIGVVRSDARLK